MSNYLLFLGAGCSTSFSVPTMEAMVSEFEEVISSEEIVFTPSRKLNRELREKGLEVKFKADNRKRELYQDISGALRELYKRYDLETVLITLEGLSSPNNSNALVSYVLKRAKSKGTRIFEKREANFAKYLQADLKNFLFQKCMFDRSAYDKGKKDLEGLAEFLTSLDQNLNGKVKLPCWTFTTNYDLYFDEFLSEKYSKSYSDAVLDYFERKGNPPYLDLDRLFLGMSASTSDNVYLKLHGSIDWFKDKEGAIVKTTNPRTEFEPGIMIYPTSEKPLYLEPWIYMMMILRRALKNANFWITIGYSFNDEYIRNIFIELLKNGFHKLVIIGREGKSIADKYFGNRKNVRGFNQEFAKIRESGVEIRAWLSEKEN